MALDFITEADSRYLTDNFLSAEDWGTDEDLCSRYSEYQHGFSEADNIIKDLPHLEPGIDTAILDGDELAATCFTDEIGDPWMRLNSEENGHSECSIIDGVHIKNEPLSPPPSSSSSDASGDSIPPSHQINFLTDPSALHNALHLKFESPPLTPPHETQDVLSPLSPSTVTPIMSPVPRTTAPLQQQISKGIQRTSTRIAPKMPRRGQPATITVKQIPVGQPIVLTQAEVDRLKAQGLIKCEPNQQQLQQQQHLSSLPITSQPTITIPSCAMDTGPISPIPDPPPNVDVKAWKRQQRMIKNRESACLSRKKKKEYLQGLENHIRDLSSDNEKLRHENSSLRKSIETLQNENAGLRKVQSLLPSSNKTGTACLLTILLFVGLNFAPISILSSSDDDTFGSHHNGRALLSYSEDDSADLLTTSLSVNSHVNGSEVSSMVSSGSSTNQTTALDQARELMIRGFADYMMSKGQPSCPKLNSTETHRLSEVLFGWAQQHQDEQRKKTEENNKKEKQEKIKKRASQRLSKKKRFRNPLNKGTPPPSFHVESEESALQLYDSLFQKNYANLLDALHRRDDTFYVVSFRTDHLLLPATAHNNTQRPRMSLVMPALRTNETSINSSADHFSMMQIDCEVMSTKVVHVKDEPGHKNTTTIPPHMPPHRNNRPIYVNTADENQRHPKNVTIP